MGTRKLEYYGGDGFGGLPDVGEFIIRWGGGDMINEETFTDLSEAIKRYQELSNEQRGFWDATRGLELIDAYHWVDI